MPVLISKLNQRFKITKGFEKIEQQYILILMYKLIERLLITIEIY